jgi:2-iminobutanoate/2-iminopropanoate deaminase
MSEILSSHLNGHVAARTVVVQHLLDPRWLVEVEAIAAKVDQGG